MLYDSDIVIAEDIQFFSSSASLTVESKHIFIDCHGCYRSRYFKSSSNDCFMKNKFLFPSGSPRRPLSSPGSSNRVERCCVLNCSLLAHFLRQLLEKAVDKCLQVKKELAFSGFSTEILSSLQRLKFILLLIS